MLCRAYTQTRAGAEANSFPDDMDTTSLSLTALNAETKAVQSVMDEMLTYKNEQGILMVRRRPCAA